MPDFATMQRQEFKYVGGVVQDAGAVTGSQYVGVVNGFKTSRFGEGPNTITSDYQGPFDFFSIGVGAGAVFGLELGPSIGAGWIGFNSPTDLSIRGHAWYFSGGVGIDPAPVVDGSLGLTFYTPVGNIVNYRQQGPFGGKTFVEWSRISQNIRDGISSP